MKKMAIFRKLKSLIIGFFCLIFMCFLVSCGSVKEGSKDDLVGIYGIDVLEYKNFDNETQSLLGFFDYFILVIRKDGKAAFIHSINNTSISIDTTYTYVEEDEIVKSIILEEMSVVYVNNYSSLSISVNAAMNAKFSFDYKNDTISDTKIIEVQGRTDSTVNPYKDRTVKYVFKKYYSDTSNAKIKKVKKEQIKNLA